MSYRKVLFRNRIELDKDKYHFYVPLEISNKILFNINLYKARLLSFESKITLCFKSNLMHMRTYHEIDSEAAVPLSMRSQYTRQLFLQTSLYLSV